MTEKANPSINRVAEAYKTAGAIAYGGHGEGGFISPAAEPTEISVQDAGIDHTVLNAFDETHSGTSLDVTIDPGEAFVFGAWLAIDTSTTVTLSASTNNQSVYVGWNKSGPDDVIIGTDADFSTAVGDTDEKIPLFDFDTDSSGVTTVTERRTIGRTLDGRFVNNTNSITSNYTTDGEQLLFVDTSSNTVTVTLSTVDADSGSNVIIVDSGGNAKTNNITVDTTGSANINGSTSTTIETDYGAKAIASDGTNWYTSGEGGAGGVTVEDNGTITVDPATAINFATDLSVSDDGDGSVTVNSTVDPTIEVQDDGTSISTSINNLDFGGSDFAVTNPTTGEAEIAFTNDSLTVSSGTALSGGGTVTLGGSTTLDVDESYDFTFTSAIDFSAGLDTQGNITDGTQIIWDGTAQEIPDSAMGSIANSTLTNSSLTVAGTSVSLGGSTGTYADIATLTGSPITAGATLDASTIENEDYNESVNVQSSVSGTVTVDLSVANYHVIEASGAIDIDYTNVSGSPPGNSIIIYLEDSDGSGPHTIDWTTNQSGTVQWPDSGDNSTDSIPASSNTRVSVTTPDGGSTWRQTPTGEDFA